MLLSVAILLLPVIFSAEIAVIYKYSTRTQCVESILESIQTKNVILEINLKVLMTVPSIVVSTNEVLANFSTNTIDVAVIETKNNEEFLPICDKVLLKNPKAKLIVFCQTCNLKLDDFVFRNQIHNIIFIIRSLKSDLEDIYHISRSRNKLKYLTHCSIKNIRRFGNVFSKIESHTWKGTDVRVLVNYAPPYAYYNRLEDRIEGIDDKIMGIISKRMEFHVKYVILAEEQFLDWGHRLGYNRTYNGLLNLLLHRLLPIGSLDHPKYSNASGMNGSERSLRFSTQSALGGGRRSVRPETDTERNDEDAKQVMGQRSISLTTLQPTIVEPRMAQLETLEAKMASIEVSLSSTPRRKKNGSISGVSLGSSIRSMPKELAFKELENLRNALRDKENIIQSLRGQITVPGLRLNAIRGGSNGSSARELTEVEKKQAEDRLHRLKTDIDNKRLAIKNLKMALERLDITDNIDVRIQQAELEYQLGREELNLLTLLEETRALQLCIDESNKASSDAHTLYSCIEGSDYVILQAVSVDYDPKSPKFGAGQRDNIPGLYIDWALEESNLKKDDRLVEVNGKIVLNKNVDDLQRLLAAAPDPAQMVLLRKLISKEELLTISSNPTKEVLALKTELEEIKDRAEEAQKAKEGLKSDNIRLTHRISYLEEQVSELLGRKPPEQDVRVLTPAPVVSKSNQNVTSINISSQSPTSNGHSEVQIFQKGSQITALVPTNNHDSKDPTYPARSKSSLSNVSSTHIPAPSGDHHCQKSRHRHRPVRNGLPSPIAQIEKVSYRKHNHHHYHKEKDYSSETNSAIEQTKRHNKRNYENHQNNRYSADFSKANSEREYANEIMDKSYKKATQIVHELTRSNNMYEKHRQQCITASEKYNADILKHYNARKSTSVIDFRSEVRIGPRYGDSKSVEELDASEPARNMERTFKKVQDARSVKSLDFDSDCNSTSARLNGHMSDTNYASEGCYSENVSTKTRPTPPKKPARLSLHKTAQMNEDKERKSMKRNHNGEVNGQISWNFRRSIENALEQDSWC